jgi:hypothetical protein
LGQGQKIPWDPNSAEEIVMDFAGELLAINRCLRSPAFRLGEAVQEGDGCVGTVMAFRLSISEYGIGNEYEVRWEDGQIEWVDGRSLTSPVGNACLTAGGEERCHAYP